MIGGPSLQLSGAPLAQCIFALQQAGLFAYFCFVD